MFSASDARETYNQAFYRTSRVGMVGHSIFRDFPLNLLKKEYRPKIGLYVPTFLEFHGEGSLRTLISHRPWLNTAIFLLGDNDVDGPDDTERLYRDLTFVIMNTGRTLINYGIRPFFVPLQNRKKNLDGTTTMT